MSDPSSWQGFVEGLQKTLGPLSRAERTRRLLALSPPVRARLLNDYHFNGRRKQLQPITEAGYDTFLLLSGRGFGKNWTGAQWTNWQARYGGYRQIALVGETAADVRDYMVEGPSGVLATADPDFTPTYEPSKRRVTWPGGAVATTYSGDKPDQLRGFSGSLVWIDELAKYRFAAEAWDQIEYTLREGESPQALITTTPRPISVIQELHASPDVLTIRGSSYENKANLAPRFLRKLKEAEKTRTGRQEVHAEIIADAPGALWSTEKLEGIHVGPDDVPADLERLVVALDPSASKTGDEAGIIVAALAGGLVYVLEDLSGQLSPDEWARVAVAAYRGESLPTGIEDYNSAGSYDWPAADVILAERNQGGDMVETTIRSHDRRASYQSVWAKRGKALRAQPVSSVYAQGKVKHVGAFPELEEQMTGWEPGDDSPDRLDALVYAVTELLDLNDDKQPSLPRTTLRA